MSTENPINLEEKFKDIYNIFKQKGCELTYYVKKSIKLKYICICGIEKERLYADFMRGNECKTCKEKKLKEKPNDIDFVNEETGEIWKPLIGGWISNFGNAKNALNKKLTFIFYIILHPFTKKWDSFIYVFSKIHLLLKTNN